MAKISAAGFTEVDRFRDYNNAVIVVTSTDPNADGRRTYRVLRRGGYPGARYALWRRFSSARPMIDVLEKIRANRGYPGDDVLTQGR